MRSGRKKDYVVNCRKAAPDKRLRASTYFIREEGKLVGQLCINIDMTPYEQAMESIRQLSGMGLMDRALIRISSAPGLWRISLRT